MLVSQIFDQFLSNFSAADNQNIGDANVIAEQIGSSAPCQISKKYQKDKCQSKAINRHHPGGKNSFFQNVSVADYKKQPNKRTNQQFSEFGKTPFLDGCTIKSKQSED